MVLSPVTYPISATWSGKADHVQLYFGSRPKFFNQFVEQGLAAGYLKGSRLSRLRGFITPDAFSKKLDIPYKPVHFTNSDQTRLAGFWFPNTATALATSEKTMILGHGYFAHAGTMTALIKPLHEMGYHVFLFDFRAHGKSRGSKTSLGFHEGKDIAAAMQFLFANFKKESKEIAFLGHSMGAAAFLCMPKSIENMLGQSSLAQNINQRLQHIILDASYDVINPLQDPAVTRRLRLLPTVFRKWILNRVRDFVKSSSKTMQLPEPLNQLNPAKLYTQMGQFKNKPILILHGMQDTRTPFNQGESNLKVLERAEYRARLVPLVADHTRCDWQPIPKGKRYQTCLRDEANYLKTVKEFLSQTQTPEQELCSTARSLAL